jgi:uncharacterized damage-inducible protein DinB
VFSLNYQFNEKHSTMKNQAISEPALDLATLLDHWQEHRRLTRRAIEAFPEDKFHSFSVGGMRTFAQLTMEMITISWVGVYGMATGTWSVPNHPEVDFTLQPPATKAEVLKLWDQVTEEINKMWPQITSDRMQQVDKAFGAYDGKVSWHYFYFVDNEIHHRGQAYVYFRALGIEPPPFWDRH